MNKAVVRIDVVVDTADKGLHLSDKEIVDHLSRYIQQRLSNIEAVLEVVITSVEDVS